MPITYSHDCMDTNQKEESSLTAFPTNSDWIQVKKFAKKKYTL